MCKIQQEQPSFDKLVAKLEAMTTEFGFREEFFKVKEGKRSDYVVALSEGKLRLYCLRVENVLLIVGNGGVKRTRTYQQNSHLLASVEDLQQVHTRFMNRVYTGGIRVDTTTGVLRGALHFL